MKSNKQEIEEQRRAASGRVVPCQACVARSNNVLDGSAKSLHQRLERLDKRQEILLKEVRRLIREVKEGQ